MSGTEKGRKSARRASQKPSTPNNPEVAQAPTKSRAKKPKAKSAPSSGAREQVTELASPSITASSAASSATNTTTSASNLVSTSTTLGPTLSGTSTTNLVSPTTSRRGSLRASSSTKAYAPRTEEGKVGYPARLPVPLHEALMAASSATNSSANNIVIEALERFLSSSELHERISSARARQEEAIRKLSGG